MLSKGHDISFTSNTYLYARPTHHNITGYATAANPSKNKSAKQKIQSTMIFETVIHGLSSSNTPALAVNITLNTGNILCNLNPVGEGQTRLIIYNQNWMDAAK